MRRFLHLLLVAGLAGCVATRSDLSAPATWSALDGEPVVVVRGETVLPIVAEDTPAYRRAALFLAKTIEESCGRKPEVMVVGKGQSCGVGKGMFLGEVGSRSRTAELEACPDAFRVEAKDGCVRFTGRADFAVYDWCERELGMRYYCDGGKCVERMDEIVVRPVDYSDRPVFGKRAIGGGAEWARVGKAGGTHRGGVAVHAPHRWYRDEKLKREHPEIFETGKTPMLCYGNPATLAYYRRRIDRHIAGLEDSGGIVDAKRKVVTVCPWDAPVRCDCRWCRTLYDYADGKAGFASPVVWGHFTRQLGEWLAEAHPDYMISFLPYLNTVGVPPDCPGLVNCEAEVCTMPGLALLKDGKTKKREESVLRGWQAVTGRKVINWHYGCWPLQFTSAPYVFGRTIQRHYRDQRDVTAGSFVCGGEGDPRIALSMYVWAKCLWNPDIDVEAIYDGFARRMFGAGAAPMRALIALQEACWERQWDTDACTYHHVFEVSYPPNDVAKMVELLREAYLKTREAGDELSALRVKWYAGGFTRFLEESEFLAQRRRDTEMEMGETREMVPAKTVNGKAWAKTTVATSLGSNGSSASRLPSFVLTVRCEEPAAAKMDWTSLDDDFVWGDDCVTFSLEGMGTWKVYKNGKIESKSGAEVERRVNASVTHDETGWTVEFALAVTEELAARGFVRGNVCRWRVGDRRMPAKERVPGSRYEHSRLGTCFTQPDDDPAAFVTFRL